MKSTRHSSFSKIFDELVDGHPAYKTKTVEKIPKIIKSARVTPSGPNLVELRRQLLFESLRPNSKEDRFKQMHDVYKTTQKKIERSISQRRENEEKYSFTPEINKSSRLLASLVGKDLEERTEKFDMYYRYKKKDLKRHMQQREEDKITLEMRRPTFLTEKRNRDVESKVKKFITDNFQTNGFKNTPIKTELASGKIPIQPILHRDAPKKTYAEMYLASVGRSKSPQRIA
jgi:hypothetical protein